LFIVLFIFIKKEKGIAFKKSFQIKKILKGYIKFHYIYEYETYNIEKK